MGSNPIGKYHFSMKGLRMKRFLIMFVLICSVAMSAESERSWMDQIHHNPWHHVKATREGLVGKTTATGLTIKPESIFVALPHRDVLGKDVAVHCNGKTVVCTVQDIGPHSIYDDYWNHARRPLSEKGIRLPKKWGKAKNGAGIDLSNGLWDYFEIPRGKGITQVHWKFLE